MLYKTKMQEEAGSVECEKDGIQIRRGRLADLDDIVALHYSIFTSDTHLLMIFGEPVVKRAYRWFIDSPDAFAIVAEDGTRFVGICTACARPYTRPMLLNILPSIVQALLLHPQILLDPKLLNRVKELFVRGARKQLQPSEPPAQFGPLAVHPDYHGSEAPTKLVLGTISECRKRCWQKVIASIYKSNLPSRFHFAKLGFQENSDWETDSLIFMELDLKKM